MLQNLCRDLNILPINISINTKVYKYQGLKELPRLITQTDMDYVLAHLYVDGTKDMFSEKHSYVLYKQSFDIMVALGMSVLWVLPKELTFFWDLISNGDIKVC